MQHKLILLRNLYLKNKESKALHFYIDKEGANMGGLGH
jgi:hypothetical protein